MNILKLSRESQINRPTLYKILPTLIKKELIKEIKVGKRIEYIANSPENLNPLLNQSKNILENIIKKHYR